MNWLCMKWCDMVHGCMVYTEYTEKAAVLRDSTRVSAKQCCKHATLVDIQHTLWKATVTHLELHATNRSESAWEWRIALCKSHRDRHHHYHQIWCLFAEVVMDQAPPPSYEDVVKGGEAPMHYPSAPPPPGAYQQGAPPPPQTVPQYPPTPLPQGPQPPFAQPGYPPSSIPMAGQPQAGGAGYPQYTYNTVQAGVAPGGGYQYNANQAGVNPITAGYQTTPLVSGYKIFNSKITWLSHQRIKTWLNINYTTVHNNTYCIF